MGFTGSFSADIVLGAGPFAPLENQHGGKWERGSTSVRSCLPLLLSSLHVPRVWPEVLESIATSEARLRSDMATSEVPKLIMALAYGRVFCAPLFVKGGYSVRV